MIAAKTKPKLGRNSEFIFGIELDWRYRRNETLSSTSIIEFNIKSELPMRNKVTNFQKIEMIAAKIKPKLGGSSEFIFGI